MEKLQPNLRFSDFKDEWKKRKLSDFLTFKNGINASKEDYGSGYKFINVLDIIQNDFITHDKIIGSVHIKESEFTKNIVEYGDILFQRSSETREEVGQANVYLDKDVPATFGGFVIRGKKISEYNPVFMNIVLKTTRSRKEITSKSGGSTRYNVGQDTLGDATIYLPNLNEQSKISSFFSTVDEKIQLLKKQQAHLEKYKKGVMQKVFSRELRFKDEEGNDFPEWESFSLSQICSRVQSGGTPKSTVKSYYDGNIPFLSISDMTKQGKYLTHTTSRISEKGLKNSSSWIVPENTIIYSMYASVGFVAINKIPIATSQAVLNLVIKPEFNVEYIYYFLLDFKRHIAQFITTGTQGNLNAQTVKDFSIEIPNCLEQQKIASFLSAIDEKIDHCKEQIRLTEEWKKGLLQQMFV